jgi:hypothetical protein
MAPPHNGGRETCDLAKDFFGVRLGNALRDRFTIGPQVANLPYKFVLYFLH